MGYFEEFEQMEVNFSPFAFFHFELDSSKINEKGEGEDERPRYEAER